jgi:hypothetical protein
VESDEVGAGVEEGSTSIELEAAAEEAGRRESSSDRVESSGRSKRMGRESAEALGRFHAR